MDFEIKDKPAGGKRAPGIGTVWYGEYNKFDVIGTIAPSPATQRDKVVIAVDHTFTDPITEGFRKMYTTDTKSALEGAGYGEKDSGGADIKLNAFFPGTSEEFAAFLKDDPDLILLVNPGDCSDSTMYQIGTKCSPAKIMKDWGFNSGMLGDGTKGFEFRIQAFMPTLLFYEGLISEPTGA